MNYGILPFILSSLWEVLSPLGFPKLRKRLVESALNSELSEVDDRAACKDLIEYSNDITQVTAGFVVTFFSALLVLYPLLSQTLYILTLGIIFCVGIILIIISYSISPLKWFTYSLFGKWSIPTMLSVLTNIAFIFFISYLPKLKVLFPSLFK